MTRINDVMLTVTGQDTKVTLQAAQLVKVASLSQVVAAYF